MVKGVGRLWWQMVGACRSLAGNRANIDVDLVDGVARLHGAATRPAVQAALLVASMVHFNWEAGIRMALKGGNT